MRLVMFFFVLVFSLACSSTKSRRAEFACGPTKVQLKEMEGFGFTPAKNKVHVVRVFATWCPYCKDDLAEIGKRFKSGQYAKENVQVLLLSYHNRRESKETYDRFVADTFPGFGIPADAAQIVWVDKDYKELSKVTGGDGRALFAGWKGVPYGMIFGKDGRLVFRGQFTTLPETQREHYDLIREISKEKCGSEKRAS